MPGPEGLLAILANAKVSAGQDHNTLLFVLTHNTQLVLTLTFNLNKDDIFLTEIVVIQNFCFFLIDRQ